MSYFSKSSLLIWSHIQEPPAIWKEPCFSSHELLLFLNSFKVSRATNKVFPSATCDPNTGKSSQQGNYGFVVATFPLISAKGCVDISNVDYTFPLLTKLLNNFQGLLIKACGLAQSITLIKAVLPSAACSLRLTTLCNCIVSFPLCKPLPLSLNFETQFQPSITEVFSNTLKKQVTKRHS